MKKIILPVLALLMSSSAFAQNYYHVKKEGANPTGYASGQVFATSGNTVILNKTSNDVLSGAQTIPFTFNFYGTAVSSYKASDNGYITFNTSATSTVAPGSSLTSADPNNAIYAFWKDFELKAAPNANFPIQVFSYNTGAAPNRRHVIQFFGLSAKGSAIAANTDVHSFAIVLYEGTSGRFDIIYNAYGTTGSTGLIGCENSDGSVGYTMGGSTSNFKVASDYSDAKNLVYQFNYGIQADLDPALLSTNLTRFYKVGDAVSIGGVVTNYGKTPITALKVNYSIDGGAAQTYTMGSLSLMGSGDNTIAFTHNIPWSSGIVGTLSAVRVWVSDPNADVDADLANSELTASVLRNQGTSTVERNVLFEEATGGWCGYCPDGHLIMKDVVDQNPDRVIPAMHHNSSGTDLMATAQGDIINAAYAKGYPDGFIDRTIFPANRGTWAQEITNRLSVDAPVKVTIVAKSYNPTTRTIVFRVNARFSDYWAGDLRIGAIVTEDEVRGNPANNYWSQHNYYSKFHSSGGVGGASHPLYNELEYMDGYRHQHVTRGFPGNSAWGLAAIIPDVAEPDVDYTYDFTYVVGAETKVSYSKDNNTEYCNTKDDAGSNYGWNKVPFINLIGFVAEYDGANVNNRPILNAGSTRLWNLAANIQEAAAKATINSVYPNPAKDFANIKINLTENTNVKIEVYNTVGQLVSVEQNGMMEAGENNFLINTANLSTGIYTINVTTLNGTSTTKLNVVR
ncbi:MAG: T9SS type A sorting domain-containing protein [bacterium]|nr:T9SS type A sorting domain-containing protein [bacterium]